VSISVNIFYEVKATSRGSANVCAKCSTYLSCYRALSLFSIKISVYIGMFDADSGGERRDPCHAVTRLFCIVSSTYRLLV